MARSIFTLVFAVLTLCSANAIADDYKLLRVGYNDYNMEFDSDLWDRVAKKSGFKYNLVKYSDIGTLIKDVEKGNLDIAMGGISITSDREKIVDFTKPYLNTGLKIAVLKEEQEPTFIESITDTTFIKGFVSSMTSPEVKVIALSIYFCLVTSSTVGYGDFSAKRLIGRICTVVVIITGVSFFANLTGYIAAERAVDIVSESDIKLFRDLGDKVVATKAGTSTSRDRLHDVGANVAEVQGKDWLQKAKEMLRRGEVDAIVWDSPLIDKIDDDDIKKIEKMFYPQYYGFCVQEESDLEESLNISLLSILSTNDYIALIKKHYNR